tara:strand:+ start:6272 stop:6541 length:270 start_codon:yes stop_codon:yes gene_type:complete
MKEIIERQSEMLDFYRRYYRDLHDLIQHLVYGAEHLPVNIYEEVLEDQNFDIWAQLGHLDSLEKSNKDLIKFPMMKHKPFFKEDNNETE